MNRLEKATRWLKDRFDYDVSVEVAYITGNESTEVIRAIPGRTDFEEFFIDDARTSTKAYDWCILAEDLVVDSQKITPQDGHEIVYRTPDGRDVYFRVLPFGSDRAYDTMDQLGTMLRVHTKLDRIVENP